MDLGSDFQDFPECWPDWCRLCLVRCELMHVPSTQLLCQARPHPMGCPLLGSLPWHGSFLTGKGWYNPNSCPLIISTDVQDQAELGAAAQRTSQGW